MYLDPNTSNQQMDENSLERPNRVHSIHRNSHYNTQGSKIHKLREARTGGSARTITSNSEFLEQHANMIVSKMEQDLALMEDSPSSEELRTMALRDMPQCLTVKRHVRVKLTHSVSQKSKRRPIGCLKRFKYQMRMGFSRMQYSLKNLAYVFELWYGPLKTIEGHFGSGVASFFKFLRWLFILNALVAIYVVGFIVAPQLAYAGLEGNLTKSFSVSDIFTGEGFFTNTVLYYGTYSNKSVSLSTNLTYSMPAAYFFTNITLYLFCFVCLSVSVARSYRKNYIETEGGLKNIYAHKVFCGWDYNIATKEAAELKQSAIYREFIELLSDSVSQKAKSCLEQFQTICIQACVNILTVALLVILGYVMWILLDSTKANVIVTAVLVNVIMAVFPIIFSFIIQYEDYKNPRNVLIITLLRTFLLGCVIIGILLTFWIKKSDQWGCWETSLGQEIYRLILFDFVFSVLVSSLFDLGAYLIKRYLQKTLLEFDVARHTMQLIYNQTLFWAGFLFAPLLAPLVVLKLFLTFYCRKTTAMFLCKPSAKSWRAAQTQTWFLMISFMCLLLMLGLFGYIIVYLPASNCGAFRDYEFMYQVFTEGMLELKENHRYWQVVIFLTKPGVISLVLVGLGVWVFYLREEALAQVDMVQSYRDMLIWASKDKEFVLQEISRVTKGQWQYKIQDGREMDPIISLPDITLREGGDFPISQDPSYNTRPNSTGTELTSSSSGRSVSLGDDSEMDAEFARRYQRYS